MTEHANEQQEKMVDFNCNSDYQSLELYSIYDSKTKTYMPPFFCKNRDDAVRQVKNLVNYSNSLINKFPGDYCLYFVGTFDENNGTVSSIIGCNLFIAYLSDFETDDTLKYDQLKKDVQTQNFQITGALKEFDDKVALYEKKLRELSVLEDNIKAKYQSEVDLPPIPLKKLVVKKKQSLLDKLFT